MSITPRISAALISSRGRHVRVSEDGCLKVAQWLAKEHLDENVEQQIADFMPKFGSMPDVELAQYIFFLDLLNFSFFNDDGTSLEIIYPNQEGKEKRISRGYWAHVAALHRAKKEGNPFLQSEWMIQCSKNDMSQFYRKADGQLGESEQMSELRSKVVNEAGQILMKEYGGYFANMISKCNQSAIKLSQLLADNFESFRDEGWFPYEQIDQVSGNWRDNEIIENDWKLKLCPTDEDNNEIKLEQNINEFQKHGQIPLHRVTFHKRAQITATDIWKIFNGQNLGQFNDMSLITMFADYRVPQVLAHLGAIEYSKSLENFLGIGGQKDEQKRNEGITSVSNCDYIVNGSRIEMEIRGCSIAAISKITEMMLHSLGAEQLNLDQFEDEKVTNEENEVRKGLSLRKLAEQSGFSTKICDAIIDNFLWVWGKMHLSELRIAAHRTRTCFY